MIADPQFWYVFIFIFYSCHTDVEFRNTTFEAVRYLGKNSTFTMKDSRKTLDSNVLFRL